MKRVILMLTLLFVAGVLHSDRGLTRYDEIQVREQEQIFRKEKISDSETKQPKYAPGGLIVKFKPSLGKEVNKLIAENKKFETITKTPYLDNLIQKYNVKIIKRAFKKLDVRIRETGRSFQKLTEETKTRFPIRAKRAPKDGILPNLDHIFKLKLESRANILAIVAEFKREPYVVDAQPNYLYQGAATTPDDPYFDEQWNLKRIQMEEAWGIETGSDDIILAVVDTGVELTHPDLQERLIEAPYDFVDIDVEAYELHGYELDPNEDYTQQDTEPEDIVGHGTHVAGIACTVTNNGVGIAGMLWGDLLIIVSA